MYVMYTLCSSPRNNMVTYIDRLQCEFTDKEKYSDDSCGKGRKVRRCRTTFTTFQV